MSKTIAIVNRKGGVGKTTSAWNLGTALSRRGQRSWNHSVATRAD